MSWAPGWYGYDVTSEEHCAWGPEETMEAAREYPGYDCDDEDRMKIHVFHIDKSEQPSLCNPKIVVLRTAKHAENTSADLDQMRKELDPTYPRR